MKKQLAIIIATMLTLVGATTRVEAVDVVSKGTVTTNSMATVCGNLFNLASVNRSWIIRQYSNSHNYSVLVGLDWELSNATNSEKLALIRTHVCASTGVAESTQSMLLLGYYHVQPVGEYTGGNLILYPTTGIGTADTVVSATAGQTCLDILNMANRAHRNDLIVRSYTGQANYTAVVGATWSGLTSGEKLATLLALQCYTSGSTTGKQDMLIQEHLTGKNLGWLINGQLELY
mgnify:FL=1